MLQNAYFLAKIGADTAENEQHFAEILPIGRREVGPRRPDGPLEERRAILICLGVGLQVLLDAGRVAGNLGFLLLHFFCKILQIFGGLVLGCIKTKFCKNIYV